MRRRYATWLAGIVLLAISLTGGPPAAATEPSVAERLAALVRQGTERQELPPMAPTTRYVGWVGNQRTELDAAGISRMHEANQRLITSYQVRDFTVHAVDCGQDMCWIRYGYRFTARVGAMEVNGASENQEFWVREGDRLLLAYGIARQ